MTIYADNSYSIGNTPLVRLKHFGHNGNVVVKIEGRNPSFSVKCRIGANMIWQAEKDGILTVAGKQRWRPETIKKILLNDKYIGDALLQKTFTVDFHTKKRVKNEGHAPQNFNKKLKRETVNLDELKAIADALDIKFEQVFILHDGNKIKTGNE